MNWDNYSEMNLPVVMSYDDKYDKASWDEVEQQCINNDPVALYEKARRLHIGEGTEVDLDQAKWCYEQVLKYQKHTKAMYYLAQLLSDDNGNALSADCEKLYRLGSNLGDADCSFELGYLYKYGEYVEKDPEKAIQCFVLSDQQGGDSYSLGAAGETCLDIEDYKRALIYLSEAYQKGNVYSGYYIGKMYYYGRGVEENDDIAFPYLKRASDEGYKEANVMLGAMYGWGHGTEKNVQLAFQCLDDVTEGDLADSYYVKAQLSVSEGNRAEGIQLMKKAAELGHEAAQRLLAEGFGKTDEEAAREGSDPYAMIRYSAKLIGNNELTEVRDVIVKANQLYPDNLDVKEQYVNIMYMYGFAVKEGVGAIDDAYRIMGSLIKDINVLHSNGRNSDALRDIENSTYMIYAECAYLLDHYDEVLSLCPRIDHEEYPYAVVLSVMTHFTDLERYAAEVVDEANFLKRMLRSDEWGKPFELASAYYALSVIYSNGVGDYIRPDVDYAYDCILKCAEIHPKMAESHLKCFSKSIFGKITYNGR